jgi:hypothetical protein
LGSYQQKNQGATMNLELREQATRYILAHGGEVRRIAPSAHDPFLHGTEFRTPDGQVRPIEEFHPSLFNEFSSGRTLGNIRAGGTRINTTSTVPTAPSDVRIEQAEQAARATAERQDPWAQATVRMQDDFADATSPLFGHPLRSMYYAQPTRQERHEQLQPRRRPATQQRGLRSGRLRSTGPRSNTQRNRDIYQLRGVLASIKEVIPADIYNDNFTEVMVDSFLANITEALDTKRIHSYIGESCLKAINNGKTSKSTAHNHQDKKCCKCGEYHDVTFKIHKDRLARLEASSQS